MSPIRSDGSTRGHQGELCLCLRISGTNQPNSLSPAIRKDITNYYCTLFFYCLCWRFSTVKKRVFVWKVWKANSNFQKVVTIPPHLILNFIKISLMFLRLCLLMCCQNLGLTLFFNLAKELCTWDLCRMWGCWGLLLLLAINRGLVLVGAHIPLKR